MSEEQKIIDLENEISFLKEVLREKQKEIEEKNIAINKMSKDISRQLEERNKKDYISKDKIREKLKKLQREEDKIYKLNYELEPVKAIDSLLLRIGDLEKLLKEK